MTTSRYRYTIFSLLFLIALINYIDRGALSFAANAIAAEYHFSKVQLGAVLGYFGFGYLFGSLCGGFLADRIGTKKVWLLAGVLWSLLEIATAWAGNWAWRCLADPLLWALLPFALCLVFPKARPMR